MFSEFRNLVTWVGFYVSDNDLSSFKRNTFEMVVVGQHVFIVYSASVLLNFWLKIYVFFYTIHNYSHVPAFVLIH